MTDGRLVRVDGVKRHIAEEIADVIEGHHDHDEPVQPIDGIEARADRASQFRRLGGQEKLGHMPKSREAASGDGRKCVAGC